MPQDIVSVLDFEQDRASEVSFGLKSADLNLDEKSNRFIKRSYFYHCITSQLMDAPTIVIFIHGQNGPTIFRQYCLAVQQLFDSARNPRTYPLKVGLIQKIPAWVWS